VRDVGSREAVGRAGQPAQVDRGDGSPLQVVAEDGLAGGGVRRQHQQGAVEPARAAHRLVDVPRVVGGGQHEHALVALSHVVELGQQLVDRAAHRAVPQLRALLAERVDLVEEQHARRAAAHQLEDVVQVALALAGVHVEHVGEPDGKETRAVLARDRPRQERLAATRRSVEEQPAAQALAIGLAQLGMAHRAEEGELEALLDLLHAADVRKTQRGPLEIEGGVDRQVLALGRDEHRRHSVTEVVLGAGPVEPVGGLAGGRGGRLLRGEGSRHEGSRGFAAGVAGQRLRALGDDVLGAPGAQQLLGEVHPQGRVVRSRGDRGAQRAQQRRLVGHGPKLPPCRGFERRNRAAPRRRSGFRTVLATRDPRKGGMLATRPGSGPVELGLDGGCSKPEQLAAGGLDVAAVNERAHGKRARHRVDDPHLVDSVSGIEGQLLPGPVTW